MLHILLSNCKVSKIPHFHEFSLNLIFGGIFEIMSNCAAAVAWASASSSTSSCSLGRGYSEAASPSSFKTKARRGKKGQADCRFVCLCFEIWSPKLPLFPFFLVFGFFCTLFLMIESKEQANRSSICLIENYTKQIVVYIYRSVCSWKRK